MQQLANCWPRSRAILVAFLSSKFSPDGYWIITVGDQTVRFWSVANGRVLAIIRFHHLGSVAFSPTGKLIVIVDFDFAQDTRGIGTAQLWEHRQCPTAGDAARAQIGFVDKAEVVQVGISRPMVSGSSLPNTITTPVYGTRPPANLWRHFKGTPVVSFTPSSRLIICGSSPRARTGTAQVWNVRPEAKCFSRSEATLTFLGGEVLAQWRADTNDSYDGSCRSLERCQWTTDCLQCCWATLPPVYHAEFSQNAKYIVTARPRDSEGLGCKRKAAPLQTPPGPHRGR